MSQKIINDMGEEIEVFTNEELEAQKESAIEDYKTNNPDKTDELTKLQEDLQTKEEELSKFKNKDLNFTNLRIAKEKAESEIDKLKTSIDDKIGIAKKEILEGVMKEHYNDTIKNLVGDDKDLLAKVELQYKRLADTASTKEEISKKINDAYILATGDVRSNVDMGAFSSGGVGRIKVDTKSPLSQEEKDFTKKLAAAGGLKLEDKDFISKK